MGKYELEQGEWISPADKDNHLCLKWGHDKIYFTKKDVEHMLTMFKKAGK